MALVKAMSDIAPDQIRRATGRGAPGGAHTDFFKPIKSAPAGPAAYLVHNGPSRPSAAHYHEVDQVQIILEGKGMFGRYQVEPYDIHFARAYTPYGPLMSDKETGWTFLTLRTHYDSGAQRVATELERLMKIPGRQPWQTRQQADLPALPAAGANLREVVGLKDENGLAAYTFSMAAGARYTAPDPAYGNGQFVLVLNGSLVHEGAVRQALAIVYVDRKERAFELQAGAEGMQGIVVNFPRPVQGPAKAAA